MLKRALSSVAVAAPLSLAITGVAVADSYSRNDVAVGTDGIDNSYVRSATDGAGGSSYRKHTAHVGPDGASVSRTRAAAGNSSATGLVSGLVGGLL